MVPFQPGTEIERLPVDGLYETLVVAEVMAVLKALKLVLRSEE
jgi:hypothetical protein